MKSFKLTITNNTVRRVRAWLENRKLNRLRNNSFKHKRYWRATSKSGTVDLGHLTEYGALDAAAKLGPVVYNDWVNAVIVYDDGSLKNPLA